MTKEDYIKQCRYYKGEITNPFEGTNNSMLWFYEQKWCEFAIDNPAYLDECIEEYKYFGLTDFSDNDNVPISLKAIFFNRFLHWGGGYNAESDRKNFKEWYKTYYLKS